MAREAPNVEPVTNSQPAPAAVWAKPAFTPSLRQTAFGGTVFVFAAAMFASGVNS